MRKTRKQTNRQRDTQTDRQTVKQTHTKLEIREGDESKKKAPLR